MERFTEDQLHRAEQAIALYLQEGEKAEEYKAPGKAFALFVHYLFYIEQGNMQPDHSFEQFNELWDDVMAHHTFSNAFPYSKKQVIADLREDALEQIRDEER